MNTTVLLSLWDALAERLAPKVNYRNYIRSARWKRKADAAKARAGHRCQVCNSPDNLNAHHRTYSRLGHEHPSDITVLCRKCHKLLRGAGA